MLSDNVPYYILDLLQQVPSIYVRGLGRFEAIFHPAVLDIPQAKIKPPFVEPDFRADEESISDILPAFMHYVTGVGKEPAEAAIEKFVEKVHSRTLDDNSYTIDSFGTFNRNHQGNIRFTPDWDAFNLSFRGLEVLDLTVPDESGSEGTPYFTAPPPVVSIITEPREVVHQPVVVALPITEVMQAHEAEQPTSIQVSDDTLIQENTSKLWWMILVSALVLITVLCAYLAWDIISNRNKLNDLKQIYPDTSEIRPAEITTPVDTAPVITEEQVDSGNEEENIPVIENPPAEEISNPCFVVVGAFANTENVSKMVVRLESLGYTTEQIKGGSLTRVAIRTSCDPANLQKKLDEARSSINPEAWIY